jgi:hypothetical protein
MCHGSVVRGVGFQLLSVDVCLQSLVRFLWITVLNSVWWFLDRVWMPYAYSARGVQHACRTHPQVGLLKATQMAVLDLGCFATYQTFFCEFESFMKILSSFK